MEDVSKYPWLHQRGQTYYLRAAVPRNLRESVGSKEIWRSLRTKDRRVAIDRLRKESAEVVELFEEHGRHIQRLSEPPLQELSPEQLKFLGDAYFVSLLDEDDDKRLSGFEGRDFDEDAEDLELLTQVDQHEYARGQVSEFYKDEAEEVLSWEGIGLRLAPGSPSWPRLYRTLYEATIKARDAIRERNAGKIVVTPSTGKGTVADVVKPTLEDAKDFYIAEKVSGTDFAQKKRKTRIETLMRIVKAALGEVPPLPDWTVEDAYKVRDYLLGKGTLKPSSVRRELNDLKGIFSLYKKKKLPRMENPFAGIELPKNLASDKESRSPLPLEVILEATQWIGAKANPELGFIWRILVGTGCRLAEVTGLRIQDVAIDDAMPHLKLVPYEGRPLKNNSSKREVPLVGDALVAAQEALKETAAGQFVFPRYSGPKGPNAASQSLMKRLRSITADKLHTVHSLRHNMADRLDAAGVYPTEKSAILGHLEASSSERHYGSLLARREVLTKAMKRAFGAD
jgi:integrase